MAETETQTQSPAGRAVYVEPVITFFRVVGMFLDVATIMIRLLYNVLAHDTPHGKKPISEPS